ncbi:hypothetical protein B0H15DRAFT_797791 [Mycena belliarum]|uniref:Uncharacterized protein n=1 Tax=Mycena belliarum TaxID=1033014 RepID=A0AAD6UBI5_9AGAR|nr:hypothetical protein B0H15DRAFT_797791 [Mycena belliae]
MLSCNPTHQFVRELVVCAALSFIIVLGVVHATLHLLHLYIESTALPCTPAPLPERLATPALQLSRISEAHTYLLVVFKITLACTVLVFAGRELVVAGGVHFGWWGEGAQEGVTDDDLKREDEEKREQGANGYFAPVEKFDEYSRPMACPA